MQQNGNCKYIRRTDPELSRATGGLQWVIIILLGMMAMDFYSHMFYLAIAAFGLVVLEGQNSFSFHRSVIPALILAVSAAIFSDIPTSDTLGRFRPFVYPLCVLAGYNFVDSDSTDKTRQLAVWAILALAIGSYGHYILNMLINLGKNTGRNTIDFWTKSIRSATGQSSLAVIMTGASISVLFSKERPMLKLFFFGALLSILYYNLVLGGRTVVILCVLLLAVNFTALWFLNDTGQRKARNLVIVMIVIALIMIVISTNMFGIMDTIRRSNLYQRFFGNYADNIQEDHRLDFKRIYIKHMLSYPFGGDRLRKAVGGFYAHDIILDTYSNVGIFGTFAVIIMLIDTIRKSFRLCHHKLIDRKCKSLLLNVLLSLFIIFGMEPILEGMPWMFACYCVLYGLLTKLTEC